MKICKINASGDGNIVVNDIVNSEITINQDSNELSDILREMYNWNLNDPPRYLSIIVISTSADRIDSIDNLSAKDIALLKEYYGETPKEWKPFDKISTISDLIGEFHNRSGFKIEAFFIDGWELENEDFVADLKEDISPRAILIADCLSLYFDENKTFAKIFNKSDIGGCLLPFCREFNPEITHLIENLKIDTFNDIYQFFYNKFNRHYLNIEMNVSRKEIFFRRISNISIKHLNVPEPITVGNWIEKYKKPGLISQTARF